jgi:hypothetical protein
MHASIRASASLRRIPEEDLQRRRSERLHGKPLFRIKVQQSIFPSRQMGLEKRFAINLARTLS